MEEKGPQGERHGVKSGLRLNTENDGREWSAMTLEGKLKQEWEKATGIWEFVMIRSQEFSCWYENKHAVRATDKQRHVNLEAGL